jgi:hypothetical protein
MLLLVIEAPSEYFLLCPAPVAFTAKRTLLCVFLLPFVALFFVEDPVGFRRGGSKGEEGHAGLVFNSFATRQGTLFVESVELMDSHMHACKLHTVSVALSACIVFVIMMVMMCC